MKFIPEKWEPIYYYNSGRNPYRQSYHGVFIEKMIEDRRNADIEIGMIEPSDFYSIEINKDDQSRKNVVSDIREIKQLEACHYNNPRYVSREFARFVVVNQSRTIFYHLVVRDPDYVVFEFVGDPIKKSDTILYQIKEYIRENELGNPDEIMTTLTTSEESKQLEDEIEWKAWVGNWVLAPTEYDGYYGIAHYPRNP